MWWSHFTCWQFLRCSSRSLFSKGGQLGLLGHWTGQYSQDSSCSLNIRYIFVFILLKNDNVLGWVRHPKPFFNDLFIAHSFKFHFSYSLYLSAIFNYFADTFDWPSPVCTEEQVDTLLLPHQDGLLAVFWTQHTSIHTVTPIATAIPLL